MLSLSHDAGAGHEATHGLGLEGRSRNRMGLCSPALIDDE